jgi:hypothetical protein
LSQKQEVPLRPKVSLARPEDDTVVSSFCSYQSDPPSSAIPRSNPSYLKDRFVTVYKPQAPKEESKQDVAVPFIKDALLRDREVDSSGQMPASLPLFVVPNPVVTKPFSRPLPTKKKALDIHHARAFLKKLLTRYKVLKILQICLSIDVGVWTSAGGLRNPDTSMIVNPNLEERTSLGLILVNGSERPIVAETMFQLVAVYISQFIAWLMYPGEYCSV